MSLESGTRLGPYEIVALLGAGGMGEVYRARDVTLDRDVALKALPASLAADPERVARFEREAKTLAALQHAQIAAIYGLHDHGGTRFLALELVPGEDLSRRLAHGPIPVEDALRMAAGVAAALEAAHEQGIVHRDLKPANLQVMPDGGIKVLDFGLAKVLGLPDGSGASDPSLLQSPTVVTPATMVGVILGTAAYMSPEQARGMAVDRRADIWAFGCVLYEMLTGKRAFEGETVSDTLASVLKSEPDWDSLGAVAPPVVVDIVRRCLRKDPKRRMQSMGDTRVALEDVLAAGAGAPPASATVGRAANARHRWVPWAVAGLFAVVAVATSLLGRRMPNAAPAPMRLSVNLSGADAMPQDSGPAAVLSPDGKSIAYVAGFGQGQRLFIRRLDELQPRVVPDLEGVRAPFFSPDGAWVGVVTAEALYKVPASGGGATKLCDLRSARGATWAGDGSIVVAPNTESGLFRVPAAGGAPTPLTAPSDSARERSHRWPFALPGGAVLYMSQHRGETYDQADINVWIPGTGKVKNLIHGGAAPQWSPGGYLLYARQGSVFAVPFDLAHLEVRGEPVEVVKGVLCHTGDQTSGDGSAEYSVAGGMLLYRASDAAAGTKLSRAVLVDRQGNVQRVLSQPEGLSGPRVSPDGKQVALAVAAGGTGVPNLWTYDVDRGAPTRITFDKRSVVGITWTADGAAILFGAEPGDVVMRPADGTGAERVLFKYRGSEYTWPASFSPDGRMLAIHRLSTTTNWDVLLAPVQRDAAGQVTIGDFVPFAASPAIEWYPEFSPDGRWLAYVSTESGRNEIYVQSITPGLGKWQVTWEGGNFPRWSHAGNELFFQNGDAMLSAHFERVGAGLRFEKPIELFRGEFVDVSPFSAYDVMPDGQRFIMLKALEGADTDRAHATLVTNWTAELARLTSPRTR